MIKIFLTTILIFCFGVAKAQVTFGSKEKAEDFCLVQIDGDDAGMMLPKLSSQQMQDLKNSSTFVANDKAKGLLAYNVDLKTLVYWNGEDWILVGTDMLSPENGLFLDGTTLHLGSDLVRDTSINLNGKSFNFSIPSTNLTSAVTFNTNDLIVKTNSIAVKPSSGITINGINTINNKKLDFTLSKLDIRKLGASESTMQLDNNGVVFRKLNFAPPSSPPSLSDMLTIDKTTKQMHWESIRPFASTFNANGRSSKTLTNGGTQVSDVIVFPPGQYLLIAKANLYQAGATSFLYNYISIRTSKTSSFTSYEDIILSASTPEIKVYNTGDWTYCTPSFRHYVNFKETTYVAIYCSTGTSNVKTPGTEGTVVTAVSGKQYFTAIRLDVPVL